jgi:transcriptional regulator with XRE-family HTH domain
MGQSPRPRPKRLAKKLRQLRELLGLTQEQLAEAVGHIESPPQPGHISEYERGRREPSLLFLLVVVRLAGISMETLVNDELDLPRRLPARTRSKKKSKA